MIPRLALPLLEAVEQPVLRIGKDGHQQSGRDQAHDDTPARPVQGSILCLEELAPDDARNVGAHDKDGHGDGPLGRRPRVERHPGAVHRVYGPRLALCGRVDDTRDPDLRQFAWNAMAVARTPNLKFPFVDSTRTRFPI